MARVQLVALALAGCGFHGAGIVGGLDAADRDARERDAAVTPTPHDATTIEDAPMPVVDASLGVDASPSSPPLDCLDAQEQGVTTDGVIMIDPDGPGSNAPFSVYCDMTTAGGGWTLVWVYTFTNYGFFNASSNAVTPRPTWGNPASATPTSTTVPLDLTTTGALDFSRWKTIGTEVLVTSNINHWVKCQPAGGSLVTLTTGQLTCQMVKPIAPVCQNVVPSYLDTTIDPHGPALQSGSAALDTYYYWEGSTAGGWPTHDPCGGNGTNQVTGVTNPRGRIFLRRQ